MQRIQDNSCEALVAIDRKTITPFQQQHGLHSSALESLLESRQMMERGIEESHYQMDELRSQTENQLLELNGSLVDYSTHVEGVHSLAKTIEDQNKELKETLLERTDALCLEVNNDKASIEAMSAQMARTMGQEKITAIIHSLCL